MRIVVVDMGGVFFDDVYNFLGLIVIVVVFVEKFYRMVLLSRVKYVDFFNYDMSGR